MKIENQPSGDSSGRLDTIWSVVGGLVRSSEHETLRKLLQSGVEQGAADARANREGREIRESLLRTVADQLVSGELTAWTASPSGGYSAASHDTASALFEQVRQWRVGNRSRRVFRPNPHARSEMTAFDQGGGSTEPANVEWITKLFIPVSWSRSNAGPDGRSQPPHSGHVVAGSADAEKESGLALDLAPPSPRPQELDSIIDVAWRRARERASNSPRILVTSGVPEAAALREWCTELATQSLRYVRSIAESIGNASLPCWRVGPGGELVRACPESDQYLFDQARRWQANETTRGWTVYLASIGRIEELDRVYYMDFPDVQWLDRLRIDASWSPGGDKATATVAPAQTVEKWPWGAYTTPRMEAMAEAVREFWVGWDGVSQVKKDAVSEFLKQRGIPPTLAPHIDWLIRHPDAPSRERSKKK